MNWYHPCFGLPDDLIANPREEPWVRRLADEIGHFLGYPGVRPYWAERIREYSRQAPHRKDDDVGGPWRPRWLTLDECFAYLGALNDELGRYPPPIDPYESDVGGPRRPRWLTLDEYFAYLGALTDELGRYAPPIDPYESQAIDPHESQAIDPHESQAIDPHESQAIDPHESQAIDPTNRVNPDPGRDFAMGLPYKGLRWAVLKRLQAAHELFFKDALDRVRASIEQNVSGYSRNRPKGDGANSTGEPKGESAGMPDRVRKVGEQYTRTRDVLNPGNPNPTDREVYDALARACAQSGEANELPGFDTWQRYLREWRRANGEQKNTRRAGRGRASGSLAPRESIEPEHLPTSIRPRSAGRRGCGADD
ncbi:MAG: hypothetical protein LC135_16355 [Phycisphaerae bacterium]|nr:hypothetical protein [Phycisphaerae bacterium]MCZ2401411.1 hypothetical protein [Phycisphaerae bacterium]